LRSLARPERAALALALLVLGGCASTVARVTREWGKGSLYLDRERPLIVHPREFPPDSIELPLLVDAGVAAFMTECTVYAAWLTPQESDSLPEQEGLVAFPGRARLVTVSAPPLTFEPAEVVREVRATLTPPAAGVDRERPEAAQPSESLFLELWLDTAPDVPRENCGSIRDASPTELGRRQYLIDFGRVDPVPGSVTGGGAFVIGIVAISGILALALGG
jgi:hypothetical protein